MDGKDSRGAYAQVTAPIGDDPKVHIESGASKQGACSSCSKPRLIGAIAVAIILLIVIVIVIVFATKGGGGQKGSELKGGSTIAPSVSEEMITSTIASMSNGVMITSTIASMSNGVMMTTQPRPPTTFGPPVPGSFSGAVVMDKAYDPFFDDIRATKTTDFKANFTMAMDILFEKTDQDVIMYVQTDVDQLLQNGTNVQVVFSVSLNAINRGARDFLIDTLSPVPSTALQTYPVLYADIKEEKATALDA